VNSYAGNEYWFSVGATRRAQSSPSRSTTKAERPWKRNSTPTGPTAAAGIFSGCQRALLCARRGTRRRARDLLPSLFLQVTECLSNQPKPQKRPGALA
jgi:hypothetical protein